MSVTMFYGRNVRYRARLEPTRHEIAFILAESPLGQLVINHAHKALGCANGIQSYIDFINCIGFHAINLKEAIKDHLDSCQQCPLIKALWSQKSSLQDTLYSQRGPQADIEKIFSQNPMQFLVGDELGPLKISLKTGTFKVWLLICVTVVSRKIYIIPLENQSTLSLVKSLDILSAQNGPEFFYFRRTSQ